MDGWNTIVSFWDGLFSGAFAVSFREGDLFFFLGGVRGDGGLLDNIKLTSDVFLVGKNPAPKRFKKN